MYEMDGCILNTDPSRTLTRFYFLLGGLLYEKSTSLKLKIVYVVAKTTIYLLTIVISVESTFEVMENFQDVKLSILVWTVTLYISLGMICLVDVLIYALRDNFKYLIKAADSNFDVGMTSSNIEATLGRRRNEYDYKPPNIEKFSLILLGMFAVFMSVNVISWPIGFLVVGPENIQNRSPKFSYYMYSGIPFRNVTTAKYFLGYSVAATLLVYDASLLLALYLLTMIIVSSICNAFVSLANIMHSQSQNTNSKIENLQLEERCTSDFEIVLVQQECADNCKEYVRKYRNLVKYIEYIRRLVEFNYVIVMIEAFTAMVPTASLIILDDDMPKWGQIAYSACICIFSMFLFIICFCGKLTEDMGEVMSLEAYGIPWYHLTIKQRKTVLQLVCIFQQPIEFRGLKTFPLKMYSLLRILNSCYSILSFIRTENSK